MQLTDSNVFFRICSSIAVVKNISLLLYINSSFKENQVCKQGAAKCGHMKKCSSFLPIWNFAGWLTEWLHDSVYIPTWRKLLWSQLKESQVERSCGDRWGCLGWFSKARLCGFQKTPYGYRYSWMHSYASLPIYMEVYVSVCVFIPKQNSERRTQYF